MNRILMIACCLFLLIDNVLAENMYISENIRMVIRQGPGSQNKILETLMSGDMVELVEQGPEWSKVRLSDGREGWAPTRFLTTQIPSSLALKRLEQKYSDLMAQAGAPQESGINLKAENQQLTSDLAMLETKINTLSDDYETLKKDAADVVQLRTKYQEASAKLKEQSQKMDAMTADMNHQNFDLKLRWFLYGAGVFLAGLLMGWVSKPSRSRQSLLR
ncbi:MAG: TIGR04211 family SH3 domain-containing protein [Desulfatirhabdiaceae bacterium]